MSGISKTIERVKELDQNRVGGEEQRITEIEAGTFVEQYAIVAANSIMPIIAEVERLKAELEAQLKSSKYEIYYDKSQELKNVQAERDDFKFLRSEASKASKKYKAELETANLKISQMESAILEDYEAFKSTKAAYEQSQKELERLKAARDVYMEFFHQTKADLDTANKANADSEQIMLLIDSHDTQLADIDRLRAALKQIVEQGELLIENANDRKSCYEAIATAGVINRIAREVLTKV